MTRQQHFSVRLGESGERQLSELVKLKRSTPSAVMRESVAHLHADTIGSDEPPPDPNAELKAKIAAMYERMAAASA